MYESFFGLTKKPFSLTPDPAFLYMSEQHSIALATIESGLMSEAGITLITGEVGSGKTTLVRQALKNMSRNCSIGVVTNTHQKFGELLSWILMAFDLRPESKDKVLMYQQFIDFLANVYAEGRRVVLIIDEAQNLDVSQLEELRLLSNLNMGEGMVLQLVLVGQPELQNRLRLEELRQFAQRISLEYHLAGLSYAQTNQYIKHRLSYAGTERVIFDQYAAGAIYYHSRGIPRVINNIADLAMIYGYGTEKKVIDVNTVMQVLRAKRVSLQHISSHEPTEFALQLRNIIHKSRKIDIAAI